MTLSKYLTIMTVTTVVSWLAWFYVILVVNPEETNYIGYGLFYFSLFLSLVGTFAISGFVIRFIFLKRALLFRSVKEAYRQSFLLSLLIIISLVLLSKDLFTWLNSFFLVGGLSVLELFLLGYEK